MALGASLRRLQTSFSDLLPSGFVSQQEGGQQTAPNLTNIMYRTVQNAIDEGKAMGTTAAQQAFAGQNPTGEQVVNQASKNPLSILFSPVAIVVYLVLVLFLFMKR